MTEARLNGRNRWTTSYPSVYRFGLWLVTLVSLILVKPFLLCIYIDERLKQIDVKLLLLFLICDRCLRCDFHY
jgi:hypothetical protein